MSFMGCSSGSVPSLIRRLACGSGSKGHCHDRASDAQRDQAKRVLDLLMDGLRYRARLTGD